jgi:hypothetical protein
VCDRMVVRSRLCRTARVTSLAFLGAAVILSAMATNARAAEEDTGVEPVKPREQAASAGVLPLTFAPSSDGRKGEVRASGLYDATRQRTISEARTDVRLIGPLSLHGGVQTAMSSAFVSPFVGAQFYALSQDRHFVDAAFSMSYRGEGFNLVRALETRASFGRRFGDSALYMNLAYGHGLERAERYFDVRFSGLHGLWNHRIFFGLDSRARIDAELDQDEPAHEPEIDLMAGPVVGFALGGVALSGFGGVSAVRFRDRSPSQAGIFGGVSIGSVFF